MFQGIIEQRGRVLSLQNSVLKIKPARPWKTKKGDSVAVNGVCLTVTFMDPQGNLTFDLGEETVSITNLGGLKKNEAVNLEPPLKYGEPVHGHLVLGHAEIKAKVMRGGNDFAVAAPSDQNLPILHKGCLAVDGVSLTVNRIKTKGKEKTVTFCLIPETLRRTTLGSKKPGDWVNIETDYLAKIYKERHGKNN